MTVSKYGNMGIKLTALIQLLLMNTKFWISNNREIRKMKSIMFKILPYVLSFINWGLLRGTLKTYRIWKSSIHLWLPNQGFAHPILTSQNSIALCDLLMALLDICDIPMKKDCKPYFSFLFALQSLFYRSKCISFSCQLSFSQLSRFSRKLLNSKTTKTLP